MAAVIHHYWPGQFGLMDWIDIDLDSVHKEQFNEQVPVVEVDGKVICHHFPNLEKLADCFGASAKQVS